MRNEKAVLLRNALIDTSLGTELDIPNSLRAGADPETYIAQARGPVTAAFRRHITSAGGRIVSYIPNNAYLVRLDSGGADRLAKWTGTQSVLPFEPYYKLEMKLLEMAVAGQALPDDALLNVVLFPGSEPTVAKRLAKLGVEVLTQDRTPFGVKLVARVPSDQLTALARLTEVQGLERYRPRRLANDLTRPRLGVEVFKGTDCCRRHGDKCVARGLPRAERPGDSRQRQRLRRGRQTPGFWQAGEGAGCRFGPGRARDVLWLA